ncbi:MAG TPA: deoxyribonuclease V [Dehalococcoidia bacterium]|nr:deoxyribonuclease V [Dehalococcoidia bacterium]
MRVRNLHRWDLSPAEAIALQGQLASEVITEGEPPDVRLVAGCDIAFRERFAGRMPSAARCAVVLLSYPELAVVEQHVIEATTAFPYVPGLLAFREAPLLAQAFERLSAAPDLVLVDGHGCAHPRRFGIACHIGLLLDVPTIGVAKSRLCGHAEPAGEEAGVLSPLRDGDETIGAVLRTRARANPIYVSVGHRIGLQAAVRWAQALCHTDARGMAYRLPEPTRLADRLSKGLALP